MNTERLKKIIKIIEQAQIDSLCIEENGFKLSYQKNTLTTSTVSDHMSHESLYTDPIVHTSENTDNLIIEDQPTKEEDEDVEFQEITSPMIGTFYSRPNPEAEPYVTIGSKVSEHDVVCVVEAMKLLNEVSANVQGEVVEILVEDGQVIEFGQPLFKVRGSE